jgi:hypothetical protein
VGPHAAGVGQRRDPFHTAGIFRASPKRRTVRPMGDDETCPDGWYFDPSGAFMWRFWNGRRWTEQVMRTQDTALTRESAIRQIRRAFRHLDAASASRVHSGKVRVRRVGPRVRLAALRSDRYCHTARRRRHHAGRAEPVLQDTHLLPAAQRSLHPKTLELPRRVPGDDTRRRDDERHHAHDLGPRTSGENRCPRKRVNSRRTPPHTPTPTASDPTAGSLTAPPPRSPRPGGPTGLSN